MSRRYFVTGGAGVIGREMVPKLIARGHEVMVADLKARPDDFADAVRFRQGDLNDMGAAELHAFDPEVIVHLAATFERSTETPAFWSENFRHNVQLSHYLMSLARELPGLRRVVFASSYLIYDPDLHQFDTPRDIPASLREDDRCLPRSLIGMSKLAHEIELRFLDADPTRRFSSASARIFRGYGRRSRDVVSRWIRDLLDGREIEVCNLEDRFDYLYAVDGAEGLIRLAECESLTGVVNLGTGRARSVGELIEVLRTHFPAMRAHLRESGAPFEQSEADLARWTASIDWVPEYDLERAIPEIIEFERKRREYPCAVAKSVGVLVSSAADKVPLVRAMGVAVRRLHPESRVVAGDLRSDVLAREVADGFWSMPPVDELDMEALVGGCREHGIDVVLPTRDGELPFWAARRDRLAAAGIDVVVSSPESVDRCLDKLAFADFGRERDLPFITASSRLDDIAGERFVVKERFGAGSRSIGLGLGREAALAHAATLVNPIFQPLIEGVEISMDGWMDDAGHVKGVVLRRRNRVIDGESCISTTFRDARLESRVHELFDSLALRGPAVMQALIDDNGRMHVIECNPRFGGASTTSLAAGLDALYWSLLESRGTNVATLPFVRTASEIRQVRLPVDVHEHVSDTGA